MRRRREEAWSEYYQQRELRDSLGRVLDEAREMRKQERGRYASRRASRGSLDDPHHRARALSASRSVSRSRSPGIASDEDDGSPARTSRVGGSERDRGEVEDADRDEPVWEGLIEDEEGEELKEGGGKKDARQQGHGAPSARAGISGDRPPWMAATSASPALDLAASLRGTSGVGRHEPGLFPPGRTGDGPADAPGFALRIEPSRGPGSVLSAISGRSLLSHTGSTAAIRKENHRRVENALTRVLLAERPALKDALTAVRSHADSAVLVSFLGTEEARGAFSGIYAFEEATHTARRIFGSGPRVLDDSSMQTFYKVRKNRSSLLISFGERLARTLGASSLPLLLIPTQFDTAAREFKPLPTDTWTATADAVGIDPSLAVMAGLRPRPAPSRDRARSSRVAAVDRESTSAESALAASSLAAHRASRGVRDGSGPQEWEARAHPAGRVASPRVADRSGNIFSPSNDIVPRSQ